MNILPLMFRKSLLNSRVEISSEGKTDYLALKLIGILLQRQGILKRRELPIEKAVKTVLVPGQEVEWTENQKSGSNHSYQLKASPPIPTSPLGSFSIRTILHTPSNLRHGIVTFTSIPAR